MNNIPFFSIIIPSYNRAQVLPLAIKSVLDQSYSNWELIVIDDGSDDKTREVVGSFQDDRIKYFYQENQERSAAKNYGIQKASGEFICILDSDDYLLPNHLATLEGPCINYDFISTLSYSEVDGKRSTHKFFTNDNNAISQIWQREFFPCNSITIRKELLVSEQFDPALFIWEDFHLYFRILTEAKIKLINIYTSVVVWSSLSSSFQNSLTYNKYALSNFTKCVKSMDKFKFRFIKLINKHEYNYKIFNVYNNYFSTAVKDCNRMGALSSLIKMCGRISNLDSLKKTIKGFIKLLLIRGKST